MLHECYLSTPPSISDSSCLPFPEVYLPPGQSLEIEVSTFPSWFLHAPVSWILNRLFHFLLETHLLLQTIGRGNVCYIIGKDLVILFLDCSSFENRTFASPAPLKAEEEYKIWTRLPGELQDIRHFLLCTYVSVQRRRLLSDPYFSLTAKFGRVSFLNTMLAKSQVCWLKICVFQVYHITNTHFNECTNGWTKSMTCRYYKTKLIAWGKQKRGKSLS